MEQVKQFACAYLEARARTAWLYEPIAAAEEHPLLEGALEDAAFRREQGFSVREFESAYHAEVCGEAGDTVTLQVSERLRFLLLPGNGEKTEVCEEYRVTVRRTAEGLRVADACIVAVPPLVPEEPPALPMTAPPEGGTVTTLPFVAANAANYALTYSDTTGGTGTGAYNKLYPAHPGVDCQNFSSQCLRAGLGGSDDKTQIATRALPMDAVGGYQWYSENAAWLGTISFRNYIKPSRTAAETGLRTEEYEVPVGGDLPVPAARLLGAVLHVGTGAGEFAHAVVVTSAMGGGGTTARKNVFLTAHSSNRRNYCLGADRVYSAHGLKVIVPTGFAVYSACAHVYAGDTAAKCTKCGDVRLRVTPETVPPVKAGTAVAIAGTASLPCFRMAASVDSVTPDGTPSGSPIWLAAQMQTASYRQQYTFPAPGLYRIALHARDTDAPDSVAVCTAYTIRVT